MHLHPNAMRGLCDLCDGGARIGVDLLRALEHDIVSSADNHLAAFGLLAGGLAAPSDHLADIGESDPSQLPDYTLRCNAVLLRQLLACSGDHGGYEGVLQ